MSPNEKVSLKSLNEKLKEMHSLKEKVKELEEEIRVLKDHVANTNEKDQDSQTKECRKCKKTFSSKKLLKEHILASHPKKLGCDHCERTFSSNYELEAHADEHGLLKNFKCDKCDKMFYLEWRLTKHKNVHNESTQRCHYYLSQSRCPFEAIGCMYRHDNPSYKNDEKEHHEEEIESEPTNKNEEGHAKGAVADQGLGPPAGISTTELFANWAECFPCHLCKFTSPSSAGLAEHMQRKHSQMSNQSFGVSIPYQGMVQHQANGVSYAHCGRPGVQF